MPPKDPSKHPKPNSRCELHHDMCLPITPSHQEINLPGTGRVVLGGRGWLMVGCGVRCNGLAPPSTHCHHSPPGTNHHNPLAITASRYNPLPATIGGHHHHPKHRPSPQTTTHRRHRHPSEGGGCPSRQELREREWIVKRLGGMVWAQPRGIRSSSVAVCVQCETGVTVLMHGFGLAL